MTETAQEQFRRILHLIPRLADGERHPIDEVARMARVEPKVLLKDLEALSDRLNVPGGFIEALQIYVEEQGVTMTSSFFLRPTRLNSAELCALNVGLSMLRTERPADEHPAIDRARERLGKLISKAVKAESSGGHHASVGDGAELERLQVLRDAYRDRRKVRLHYLKANETVPAQRVACPFAIVAASGSWYMIARCETSDGVRIFRVSRITDVVALDERYEVPADWTSVSEVLTSGRAFLGGGGEKLRVRYAPKIARWIAERERAELDADGSLTVEHPLADREWAVRHVMQYGEAAEVLAPADVRAAVVERLRSVKEMV